MAFTPAFNAGHEYDMAGASSSMGERNGIFAGDDPFDIARRWLAEATATEPNDPGAMALATVDADGLPDVRMVLLKEIEGQGSSGGFTFYTNFESAKGQQLAGQPVAAAVLHWKSQRRQIRLRGTVSRVPDAQANAYFDSRALDSRIGAWASDQSRPLDSRASLIARAAREALRHGTHPARPPHWGGFRIAPSALEFWADGAFRLHDRFRWRLCDGDWRVDRLNP